jgi:hypothetical protein
MEDNRHSRGSVSYVAECTVSRAPALYPRAAKGGYCIDPFGASGAAILRGCFPARGAGRVLCLRRAA